MGQCEVHLVVPGLIDSGQVLGSLLYQRDEDQAHERVGNIVLLNQKWNLGDQDDGDEGHESHGNDECDNTFGQC